LLCRLTPGRDALSERLRVPTECADYARLLPVLLKGLPGAEDAQGRLGLIEQCDALRRPDRFFDLLNAASET
jgi:tRNA nucleotidyltransferase (CCA-adding enzyme)